MSYTIVRTLLGFVMLAVNMTSTFLIFPTKRSLRFSVGMYALSAVLFMTVMNVTGLFGAMYVSLRPLTGFVFMPVVIWLFKGAVFQKVFAFFLTFLLSFFQFSLSDELARIIMGDGNPAYYLLWPILTLTMFAVYMLLMFKYGRRIFEKLFAYGNRFTWAVYSLGAIFSFAVMIVFRIADYNPTLYILLLLFILWSFGVLCYAIINSHEKAKQKADAEFARGIVSSGREHYQKMNGMYDALGVLRHDYKYHLAAIGELANAGDLDGIKKHLTDIEAQAPENELQYYCSNSVINALLSSYAERCAKLSIRFDVTLALPETLSISNYDMCIIFGNLLENAVEACEKKERGRRIELSVKTQGTQLAVMVRNSFDGVVTEDNGQPVSEKKDGGFGLKSVRAVSDRYDGYILTEWDSDTFTVYVMLQM